MRHAYAGLLAALLLVGCVAPPELAQPSPVEAPDPRGDPAREQLELLTVALYASTVRFDAVPAGKRIAAVVQGPRRVVIMPTGVWIEGPVEWANAGPAPGAPPDVAPVASSP